MLVLLTILTITASLPVQSDMPALTVDSPAMRQCEEDQTLSITATVYLTEGRQPEQLKLLPLALENLTQERLEIRVAPLPRGHRVSYTIGLRAGSAGNAALGELQFEYFGTSDGGERVVESVFTHAGFSLQVVEPPNWGLMSGIAIGLVALSLAIAGVTHLGRQRKRQRLRITPRQQLREETYNTISECRGAADYTAAVVAADALLNRELDDFAGGIETEMTETREQLQLAVPEAKGLARLGEEVRYGGHSASAQEAAFSVRALERIIAYLDEQRDGGN